MSTWGNRAGWTTNEKRSAGWSAGSEQTKWEGSCGSWEQSGQQSRSPEYHQSPYHREPGNGYRPKANDPSGWSHGDNKPTEFEYNAMMKFGKTGVTKRVGNMFKTYEYRENQKMGVEDRSSFLVNVLEREKAAKIAEAAGHEADMQHHLESMQRAHNELMDQAVEEMRAQGVRTVEVPVEVEVIKEVVVEVEVEVFKEVKVIEKVVVVQKVYVEVDVLPDGIERPKPLFKGGQSIHQWWASWMSGAYETPAGIKGKTGRPAWYSASVYS